MSTVESLIPSNIVKQVMADADRDLAEVVDLAVDQLSDQGIELTPERKAQTLRRLQSGIRRGRGYGIEDIEDMLKGLPRRKIVPYFGQIGQSANMIDFPS